MLSKFGHTGFNGGGDVDVELHSESCHDQAGLADAGVAYQQHLEGGVFFFDLLHFIKIKD